LCSFQPFKNNIVFWVSEIAFVMTSIKYVVAMLRLSVPEDNTDVEARTEAVGTFLIVADLTTFVMFFVGGVLCVMWLNNTWSNSKDDDGTQEKKNKVKVAPASLNAPRQPKLASVISYNHDKLKAIVINDQVIKFEKSHDKIHRASLDAIRHRQVMAQARLKERIRLKRSKAKKAATVVSKKVPGSFLPVPGQGKKKSSVVGSAVLSKSQEI